MVLLGAAGSKVFVLYLDEIAVAEPLGIVEDRDNRRRDPEHWGDRGIGPWPSGVFGIALQENLVGSIELRTFGDGRCPSSEREAFDGKRIGEIARNGRRDASVPHDIRIFLAKP